MDNAMRVRPPTWYWLSSGLALIWNLLGVGQYIMTVTSSPESLVESFGQEAADMMAAQPAWYTAAFALAVFGGALGCLGLLLRKRWALWLLLLSLICVIIQNIYFFVLSDIGGQIHGGQWAMTLLIPIIALLLVWLARKGIAKHWIT